MKMANAPLPSNDPERVLSRRAWLGNVYSGLASIGLTRLLTADLAAASPEATQPPWQPGQDSTHFPRRAQRVLQIFCPGAASHMDLWDYKPALRKYHGKPLPSGEEILSFQGKNGSVMGSPWDFMPCGQTGKPITTMLPHLAGHVDDIAFVHSMVSETNTHGPACVFMNTGHPTEGFPAAGSWLSYALGSANDNLPTYVAIPDIRGEPPNGKANWSNGFLPAQHQAVVMSAQASIRNLGLPPGIDKNEETASQRLLEFLNERHSRANPGNSDLLARMRAYELAGRMQLSAPEVSDFASEPRHIHRLYGTDDPNKLKAGYARNCLLARRLLERGVRYVNLYCAGRASGVDGLLNWDAHKTLKTDYERHLPIFDQPTAALLTDLKQSGLMKDTLVLWTTEFGRMPTRQEGTTGRDHNPEAFTCWMAGAGIRGGTSYGATDDFGRRSIENPTTVWDFYATVLRILGLDHTRLTWYHNGFDRRLTDVHGRIIKEILAG